MMSSVLSKARSEGVGPKVLPSGGCIGQSRLLVKFFQEGSAMLSALHCMLSSRGQKGGRGHGRSGQTEHSASVAPPSGRIGAGKVGPSGQQQPPVRFAMSAAVGSWSSSHLSSDVM